MFFSYFEDSISNPINSPNFSIAGGSRIDWNNIINQGFGIGSQIITATGKNPSTQFGFNPATGGIFAIGGQQLGQQGANYASNPYANMTPQQLAAYQQSIGGGVGSGIDGALSWVQKNPLLVGGVVLGAFLLFRQPPGRR